MTYHVVRTNPQQENGACAFLRKLPVEPLFPLIAKKVLVRNKIVYRSEPMFPSYVFLSTELLTVALWAAINATPGVVRMMTGAGNFYPVTVPEDVMQAIRDRSIVPKLMRTARDFAHRQPVKVTTGPLAGLHGLFELDALKRTGMLTKLFNREDWHPIPEEWLTAA